MNLSHRVTRIKPSPTIAVSTRAQELKAAGHDVINLGSGEPDFDTPQHIKDAAIAAINNGETKYTAVGGTPALKNAIVNKLHRDNDLSYTAADIVVSAGAKHAIMNLLSAVLDVNDEVIIPAPYWVSYPDMTLLADATPVIITADVKTNYKIQPQQLAAALTDNSKLLIINSPSNPSGALYSSEELAELAKIVQQHPRLLVVTDDIYEHIRYAQRPFVNMLNVCPELRERVIIINGVSKAFAMTGWRIGYAAGPANIIKAMTKIQSQGTSNPCSIAQAAAVAALDGGNECIQPMLSAFNRRRQFVQDGLNAVPGIICGDIEGAFYAFADANAAIARLSDCGKISEPNDLALCAYLLETAGIAAVPGSAFGSDNCFRLSFATSDTALEDAITRIQKALA